MKTTSINKQNAIKELEALEAQVAKLKKVINNPEKITDIIHSFEDAVEYKGFQIPHYWQYLPQHKVDQEKAEFVISVLNEDWYPNFDDEDERKYYIWWRMSSSGLGFSYRDYVNWCTHSTVGGGLCLKNAELCQHIGNSPKIVALFKSFMLPKK